MQHSVHPKNFGGIKVNRAIFYLIVILGMILSVSSVCAADLNDTQTIPSDDFVQIMSNDEVSVDDNDENSDQSNSASFIENNYYIYADYSYNNPESSKDNLNKTDGNSFSDLQKLVDDAEPESTIVLDRDYTHDDRISSYGIIIYKPLTIDGNGHALDAESKSRIFTFHSDNVTVKNMMIIGGDAYDGGAISNDFGDNCNIISCNFTNCKALYEGGAVYNYLDAVNTSIISCNFKNCSSSYLGGAVSNKDPNCIMTSCDFTDCSSNYGGAVYNLGGCSMISCDFTSCYSSGSGTVNNDYGNCIIRSCKFTDCYADKSGGAIYDFEGKNLTVVSCDFSDCAAANSGAAIHNQMGKGIVKSCSFEKCYTKNMIETSQAAIYNANSLSDFAVEDCIYDENTFSDLQRLINNTAAGSTLTLNADYKYDECFAGKGIAVKKALTIDGNGHVLDAKSKSRIFNLESNNIVIKNITFINGNVTDGGAIYNGGSSNCVITSCDFKDCHSGSTGGAIFNRGNGLSVSSCNFTDCSSDSDAGSINNRADDCIIRSCNFINSSAARNAGAIYNGWGAFNLDIVSCNFTDCKSNKKGGAIYDVNRILDILSSNFVNCTSREGGVAFVDNCASINLMSCNVRDCSVSYRGGSFFIEEGGRMVVRNCNFEDCRANGYGGVFFLAFKERFDVQSRVGISNSNFLNCYSPNPGAVIHNQVGGGNVISCRFVKCYADDMRDIRKAVIFNHHPSYLINVEDCIYDDAFGLQSFAAVYYDSDMLSESCTDDVNVTADVAFNNTTDNAASENYTFGDLKNLIKNAEAESTITLDADYRYEEGFTGNGITINKPLTIDGNGHKLDAQSKSRIFNINSNNVILKNITFVGGDNPNGGAIYNYGGDNCSIVSCDFTDCSSLYLGGAIHSSCDAANFSIVSCDFTNCSSLYLGGAISSYGADCSIVSCDFKDCFADFAGAIGNLGNNSNIISCNFNNCSSTVNSGAIYNSADNCTISSCNFTDCHACDNGGAVYNYFGDNLAIVSCGFIDCSAANGGAVYNMGNNVSIFSSDFTNCKSARKGGAIYMGKSNVNVVSSDFINCTSREGGISYVVDGATVNLTSCNVKDCSVSYRGGSFYIEENGEVNVNKCNFTDCSANGYGGVFYMAFNAHIETMSRLFIHNSSFINCYCPKHGAVIHNQVGRGAVESCHFENCHSKDIKKTSIAAIYNFHSGFAIDVKNCTFD